MSTTMVKEQARISNGQDRSSFQPKNSPTRIHTIHDSKQSEVGEIAEIEQLMAQALTFMNATTEAVETFAQGIDANADTLGRLKLRKQTQEDGESELAQKIEAAASSTQATKRQILEAKKEAYLALLANVSLGVACAFILPQASMPLAQNDPPSTTSTQNDPLPSTRRRWNGEQNRVPDQRAPLNDPPSTTSTQNDPLPSTRRQWNGGQNRVPDQRAPLEDHMPFTAQPQRRRPLFDYNACPHNNRGNTTVADIAEHVGNAEFGSAARDIYDSGAVQEALRIYGEGLMRE